MIRSSFAPIKRRESLGNARSCSRAEATNYRETSLHADVMRFLQELEARRDSSFVLSSFGASPEGRDLPLVVMSHD